MTHASSTGNGVMKVLKYRNRTKYFGPTFKGDHDRLSLNGDAYYAIEETSKHSLGGCCDVFRCGRVDDESYKTLCDSSNCGGGVYRYGRGGKRGFLKAVLTFLRPQTVTRCVEDQDVVMYENKEEEKALAETPSALTGASTLM